MDAGLQTGKELFNTGMSRFLPGANTFWGSLKYYFLVDNQFVKKKVSHLGKFLAILSRLLSLQEHHHR